MQKVVAVDIGNSSMKVAVGSKEILVRIDADLNDDERSVLLTSATRENESSLQWLICSVDRSQIDWLQSWVNSHRPQDDFRTIQADDIPLQSNVEDRDALGRDRLLGAWYASDCSSEGNSSIVVDAGTAVTIDVVVNQSHIGGLIFPGSHTCLAAVSDQTDALPDLTKSKTPGLETSVQVGLSTEPAILLGVHQLQLFGIVALVRSLEQQYGPCAEVWCCGGAIEPVSSLLPETWNYDRDFLIDAIFQLKKYL